MEKKKGFANTHYPGIKADPNEGMVGIPKEAVEFLKEQTQRIGVEKQKKIWETSVLLLGSGSGAAAAAEKLIHAGVHRIGVLVLNASDGDRAALREWGRALRAKYAWVEFEPFGGLTLDRDATGILRGFHIAVDCSAEGFDPEVIEVTRKRGMKLLTALELADLSEESIFDRLASQSKGA